MSGFGGCDARSTLTLLLLMFNETLLWCSCRFSGVQESVPDGGGCDVLRCELVADDVEGR